MNSPAARRITVSRSITGTLYYQDTQADFPIYVCRIVRGRIEFVRRLNNPDSINNAIVGPSGNRVVGSWMGSQYCLLRFNKEQYVAHFIPDREYCAFSPNGNWITCFYQDSQTETGISVCDTTVWKVHWRQPGLAMPLWDKVGKLLVFARYIPGASSEHKRYTDRHGYWSVHGFPFAFEKQGTDFRRRHTHLFCADFSDVSHKPMVRRISEAEATRLIGPWFGAYLRLCLHNADLSQPSPYRVLVSPSGRGIIAQVPEDMPLQYDDEGQQLPQSPPTGMEEMRGSVFFIDAMGRTHRYENTPIYARQWSKDDQHIYGNPNGHITDEPDEPLWLLRMDVYTGKIDGVALPKTASCLMSFFEDVN